MFIYNLYSQSQSTNRVNWDSIQQSPDAVVALFPFKEPDTFSFDSQVSNPMGITKGTTATVTEIPQGDVMQVGGPMLLDSLILGLSIQSSKAAHQDGLHLSLKDPNTNLLSLINPGDWIMCWMFNNPIDAANLRNQLMTANPTKLNGFTSGLKFVGKCLAPRMQHIAGQDGSFTKSCTLQASAFSELDAQMYYDPYLSIQNLSEFEFITRLTTLLNDKFNGIPNKVGEIIGLLLAACLGAKPNGQATPNSPMRVPSIIGNILGFPSATNFMDILTTIIGIQKYESNAYVPPLKPFSSGATKLSAAYLSSHKPKSFGFGNLSNSLSLGEPQIQNFNATGYIHYGLNVTGEELTGAVFAQVVPFNNIPVWSILEQHLIPVANEMYSTLRYSPETGIAPHLIVRQIPFNTEAFVAKEPTKYTAFKELPRWQVEPEMVLSYDTGKSASMRVNYVHVQVNGAINDSEISAFQRAITSPRWDSVDIARNGLKSFITQANGVYEATGEIYGQKWTDMVTDRLIGSHLKLSGSIAVTGIQEPICVGDNLQYDGFVYHIESLEHRLQINPQSGHKSFTTNLAISNGVPVADVVLPEMGIRKFETTWADAIELGSETGFGIELTRRTVTASLLDTPPVSVTHTVVPASNVEEG